MKRLSFLAMWVVLIMVSHSMIYRAKHEVQLIQSQIKQVSREMAKERQMLYVEAAEWAYINRPENLRKLADKYLSGKNVTVDQVAEVEALAFNEQYLLAAGIDDSDKNKNKNKNKNKKDLSIAVSYSNSFAY